MQVVNATARHAETICCSGLRSTIDDLHYFLELESVTRVLEPAQASYGAAAVLQGIAQGGLPDFAVALELGVPAGQLAEACLDAQDAITLGIYMYIYLSIYRPTYMHVCIYTIIYI